MEAHESFQRFERLPHGDLDNLARTAAILVAVLAAFLSIATFLSNEAIKEAITGETKVADTTAVMEANEVKRIIADSNAQILRVVAVGSPLARGATAKAEALDARIENELAPIDRRLADQISLHQRERDHANDRHLVFEVSTIGFQVGIVLAGISIIVRRRWLLAGGGIVGVAGLVFMIAGLVI
ncbi:MAG: hypothetical protein QOH62_3246 [Solirubrobacteraceae bacterium]|jgi:hypothetical protein|nr:hypothetical protein [Solirubrobacteraceae bacterium]